MHWQLVGTGLLAVLAVAFLQAAAPAARADSTTTQYVYGADGRLSEVQRGDRTTHYTFDAAGNLLSRVTVPEPSALLLQLAALGSFGGLAFRRRSSRRHKARGSRRSSTTPGALVLATLVLTALPVPDASAHVIFPTQVGFRSSGEQSTLDVIDCCGCSAVVGATVVDPSVATVSPAQGTGTSVQFTLTSQTDMPKFTVVNITVQGFGTGDFGQACTEDSSTPVGISVKGAPNTSAQLKVSGKTGDPVNTLSGELFEMQAPDLVIPGSRLLVFQRYYASSLASDGNLQSALGTNWLHNYDIRLVDEGTFVDVSLQQGRVLHFALVNPTGVGIGDYLLLEPADVAYTLVKNGSYTLKDPVQNRTYTFNGDGTLAFDTDANGFQKTLVYDVQSRLSSVSESGRTLTLAYDGVTGKLASVTADDGRSTSYGYTGDNLTSFTDVRGGVTNYSYDASDLTKGLLTQIERPENNTPWIHTWGPGDRVTAQEDSASNDSMLGYAATTTLTDPLLFTQSHEHDSEGRLIEILDEAAQPTTFSYDSANRLTGVTDRLGSGIDYTHHAPSGRVASVTNPDGGVTLFSYEERDGLYDLSGVTYPDTTSESIGYDANGNPTSRTNRDGKVWAATYDAKSQLLTQTNPEAGVTTLTWNSNRTLNTQQDPSGKTTTYGYDAQRRPNLVTFEDGRTQAFVHDAAGNVTRFTDERAEQTDFLYDANGNLTKITDPFDNELDFAYDGQDRIAQITNPLTDTRVFAYDELGRLESITNERSQTRSVAFDSRGRIASFTNETNDTYTRTWSNEDVLLSETDPLMNTTTFTPDAMGRILSVETPRGHTTDFTYDAMGRLETRTDPNGLVTAYTYDALGAPTQASHGSVGVSYGRNDLSQITSVVDPNGQTWSTPRDANGRVVSATDPLGNTIVFSYDDRNRVSGATLPAPATSVTFTRDEAGRLTRELYSDGTDISHSYDAMGRPTGGSGMSLAYDAVGSLTESNGLMFTRTPTGHIETLELAATKTITYGYDASDRVTSVTDWDTNTTTLTYDAAGRLATITRPNGVVTTYTRDANGEISGIVEGALSSISLTRDPAGRITSADRNVPSPAAADPVDTSQTFDDASQVAGFVYDALGRRESDAARTYVWDLASRLTSYEQNAATVSFGYDARGMRVSRTAAGTTREYVWNYGLDLPSISVVREAAADQQYYVHLPNGQLLYSIAASDDTTTFYHFDEVGNTLFLTDPSGTVTDTYAYAPFGDLVATSGTSDNPFRYQGLYGVVEEGAGLYSMRARYYDSSAAAFLSRDPIASRLPHRVNPYEYASGSPLQWLDPVGTSEGSPPDWASKSGGVGLGSNTTLGGVNGRNLRTYVTPLFGISSFIGLGNLVSPHQPSIGTPDPITPSTFFGIGAYATYKIAFWQRGQLSVIFGGDTPALGATPAAATDHPFRARSTPLPANLPVPLQQQLARKRQRFQEAAQRLANAQALQSGLDILIGLGLQGEFFPTQYLSLFGQVGLRLDFLTDDEPQAVVTDAGDTSGVAIALTSDLFGAAGFTVWFK